MSNNDKEHYYRVLYAYLSKNKAYQHFCYCKRENLRYRQFFIEKGLSSVMFDYHFENYYRQFKDPSKKDFEQFWSESSNSFPNIRYFSDIFTKEIEKAAKKLWRNGCNPSMKEVINFIESVVINRQFGSMIGGRNRVLLSVNLKNVKVEELSKEFNDFLKNSKLIPPPTQRRLKQIHYHLLLTTETLEKAKLVYKEIYGEIPKTSDKTFDANLSRYNLEVSRVQFNILNGDFPGPAELEEAQEKEFKKILSSKLI